MAKPGLEDAKSQLENPENAINTQTDFQVVP